MWFSMKFLKSRDVKIWRRTSKVESLPEAEFYKERFALNQKSLPLPVQKLWPIIWFSQKWWPWPWPSSDFQKKKFCIVACLEDIFCKKNQDDRTIRVACRAFEDGQTDRQADRQADRQTDRQTNRGDQYTFRKSKISKSNKQTNRQTAVTYTFRKSKISKSNKQTDRGDQYTFRKSKISKSNKQTNRWKPLRERVLCETAKFLLRD